jgi:hypothetical protein
MDHNGQISNPHAQQQPTKKKIENRINETITTDGTRFFLPVHNAQSYLSARPETINVAPAEQSFYPSPPTGGDVWAAGQSFAGEQLGNNLNNIGIKKNSRSRNKKMAARRRWLPGEYRYDVDIRLGDFIRLACENANFRGSPGQRLRITCTRPLPAAYSSFSRSRLGRL